MEFKTSMTVYTKEGSKWIITNESTDKEYILFHLADALISKKLRNCTYIKSFKYQTYYNGWYKVECFYNNGVKVCYILPDSYNYLDDVTVC